MELLSVIRRWHHRDRHHAVGRRRPQEPAALQPLREQARTLTIVPDHLYQIAPPAPEYEQVPTVGIAPQDLLDLQRQPGKALVHIGVRTRAVRNRTLRANET